MRTSRPLRTVRVCVLVACLAATGFVCSSQALAEEPPPTETTPTEPPPVTASGPVTTVSLPPSPAPIPKPDPRPVQRKRAAIKEATRVRRPAPVRNPAPARVSTAPAQPNPAPTPAPTKVTLQPDTPPPTPAPQRPVFQPQKAATPKPKPEPALPPLRGAKLARQPSRPKVTAGAVRPAAVLGAIARDVPSVPSTVNAGEGVVRPSGALRAATSLQWLIIGLLGTAAVFFTAVGTRLVFDRRARTRLVPGDGVIARMVPLAATPVQPARQNGARTRKPARAPARSPARDPGLPETCEISWSRGYFKSDFYVASAESEGGVFEARSPAFRWTAAGEPPQDEAITMAHAALVDRLVALGFEEIGTAGSWYARRYRRRTEAEAQPVA